MLNKYLIVSTEALPEIYTKVAEVKELLDSGKYNHISDAVRTVGISRSAYYKYKDHVFTSKAFDEVERKILISLVLTDEKGILSNLLYNISDSGSNIIAINQNIPIQNKAFVLISLEVENLKTSIQDFLEMLESTKGVIKLSLLSVS